MFLTTDEGQTWKAISPDLTLHDPATMGPSGGPITYDMTGTEWYATVFTLAESPVKAGVLWAGSDDGLLNVSKDAGATWTNVTPPNLGKYAKMNIVEPSHFDAGAAYLAVIRNQQDDFHPYLLKTTDYGKTWTRITNGIPDNDFTRTIREDPVRRGLLFAGTESAVYVSFDDGAHWQSLQLNLPNTSMRDLTIHGADLLVATHGRSFWSLDDITPLRQIADSVRKANLFVFAPSAGAAIRGRPRARRECRDEPAHGTHPRLLAEVAAHGDGHAQPLRFLGHAHPHFQERQAQVRQRRDGQRRDRAALLPAARAERQRLL